ncbi:uncharacterized protein MONOS_13009p3 [Monocercomonoides exilis]|uniref:uncharacterized protein n=1 Tax=Monocercomonoides exilis TaxID=2049356 RepID=UPI0035593870|nr:hypothetical protein MONOS_13009p3 [Monocercomonoides exilis]
MKISHEHNINTIIQFVTHTSATIGVSIFNSYITEKFIKLLGKKPDLCISIAVPLLGNLTSFFWNFCIVKFKEKAYSVRLTRDQFWRNALCGFYFFIAMFLANYAAKYLSFPLKIIFSSAKILIAMPSSFIINGKKGVSPNTIFGYSKEEVFVSVGLFLGLTTMLLPIGSVKGLREGFSWIGVLMMFISTNTNCFFDELQSKLIKESNLSMTVVLMWNTLATCFFLTVTLLFTGCVPCLIKLMMDHPMLVALLFLICSSHVVSQILIVTLKQKYGIWWKNIATSLRKCLSLVVSILFFGHIVTIQQLLGIIIVCGCVFWAGNVELKKKSKEKEKQDENEQNLFPKLPTILTPKFSYSSKIYFPSSSSESPSKSPGLDTYPYFNGDAEEDGKESETPIEDSFERNTTAVEMNEIAT